MRFNPPLVRGRLLKRYKRFLADVRLDSGKEITAHTPNPGRMIGMLQPGAQVWLSHHPDPKRKLKYTWELMRVGRRIIGTNPTLSNALVAEALRGSRLAELGGYTDIRTEVQMPLRNAQTSAGRRSRIDLSLTADERPRCWVEVKTVTLMHNGAALFPDGVSERGRRHLLELRDAAAAGERAVLLFLVQRADAERVGAADHIDPEYGATLRRVFRDGVELLAYRCRVGSRQIRVADRIPVSLDKRLCRGAPA